MKSNISIVTTAKNETLNVEGWTDLVMKLRKHFQYEFKLVWVDNDSSDDTYHKALQKASDIDSFSVLINSNAGGYGDGIRYALSNCQTEYALVVPSDLQYSFEDCAQVISRFLGQEGTGRVGSILTFRKQRLDSRFNWVRGHAWRILSSTILNLPYRYDPASQLKLIRKDLGLKCRTSNFVWDIETTLVCYQENEDLAIVDVTLHKRTGGISSLPKLPFLAELQALRSLYRFRKTLD